MVRLRVKITPAPFPMSTLPAPRLAPAPKLVASRKPSTNSDTSAVFVSTFHARPEYDGLLRCELERLVSTARREPNVIFCDLFRLTAHGSTYVIQSIWSTRDNWLRHKGWQGHPAGLGLIDQCLSRPIEVIEMEEIL